MTLTEFINLYKPFELKVDDKKDKIKDYQLEKYFDLDEIKIDKENKPITFYALYRHKKSEEIIRIKIDEVEEAKVHTYKNFDDSDAIKDVKARKIPLSVDEDGVEFELLGGKE